MDVILLTNTRPPEHYDKDPMNGSMTHIYVNEMYIHFWHRSLQVQDDFAKVEYFAVYKGTRNYQRWTPETRNIVRVPHHES